MPIRLQAWLGHQMHLQLLDGTHLPGFHREVQQQLHHRSNRFFQGNTSKHQKFTHTSCKQSTALWQPFTLCHMQLVLADQTQTNHEPNRIKLDPRSVYPRQPPQGDPHTLPRNTLAVLFLSRTASATSHTDDDDFTVLLYTATLSFLLFHAEKNMREPSRLDSTQSRFTLPVCPSNMCFICKPCSLLGSSLLRVCERGVPKLFRSSSTLLCTWNSF